MSHVLQRVAHRALKRIFVVGESAECDRLAARFAHSRSDYRAVGIVDRAGAQRRTERGELVAGREHRDLRPPHDIDMREPACRQHPDLTR